MKTVQRIIDAHGGLAALQALKIENLGYMDLHIERIGIGPRGFPLVSVAHYYVQKNGDAMRDPDLVFEVDTLHEWHPVSFRQDGLGIYQEAVTVDADGEVYELSKLIHDLQCFARMWDHNLHKQGFDAVRR